MTCYALPDTAWVGELAVPDDFVVSGLIGTRWAEWGAADGPFGAPVSAEGPVEGTAGRRQAFERGEMLWAPEQDMLVSVFRLRNQVCLQWSIPQAGYDHFRCNAWFNGHPQGLDSAALKFTGVASDEQVWLRL